jgi:hypothetical protein
VSESLWSGIHRLVDRVDSVQGLVAQRLHLIAIRHWRQTGREVPDELAFEEMAALQRVHAAREVLRRVREAYDGRIILLKGPEAASYYPAPEMRPTSDLDLLAEDPEAAQRALLAAGFQKLGPYEDEHFDGLHHLRPVGLPPHVTFVEVHRRPNWDLWSSPPQTRELFDVAVEGNSGVPGLLALPPAHHALVLTGHSWGERPLRRILDLVDLAAVAAPADDAEIERLARTWGMLRMWRTSTAAADALFHQGPATVPLRVWARDLLEVRDATVFEGHVNRWLGTFWALPPHRALLATLTALVHDVTPAPGETWAGKLARIREALLHPSRPAEEHARLLGPEAVRPRFKRRQL